MNDLALFAADGLTPDDFGLTADGTPYGLAGPFAKALGYRQTKNALDLLDEDEKGFAQAETLGGAQRVSVIYESGLWRLVFRSTLPGARALTKHVTEILAELRRTGVVDTRQRPMTEIEAARRYLAALEQNERLAAKIEADAPKVLAWSEVVDRDGWLNAGDVARTIGIGRTALFEFLRDKGALLTRPKNAPSALWSKNGWAVSRVNGYRDTLGREGTTTVFSPEGVERVTAMVAKHLAGGA